MLKFTSKKKLKRFIVKFLSEALEGDGYDYTDIGALIGRGAENIKDFRIKISDDVSDKYLKKTDQGLVNIILNFASWLEEKYPDSPIPIITSGNRSALAQTKALIRKKQKGDDVFDLYVNQCFSCVRHMGGKQNAEKIMSKVTNILDNALYTIDEKEKLLEIFLEKNPISLHMSGLGIDLGDQPGLLDKLLEFVEHAKFDGRLDIIQETKPPHIHIGYIK